MRKYIPMFAILAVMSAPAFAVETSKGSMHKVCGDDVQKFCSDVEQGQGRIIACLEKNADKLSAECKTEISDKKEAIDARRENAKNQARDGVKQMKKNGSGNSQKLMKKDGSGNGEGQHLQEQKKDGSGNGNQENQKKRSWWLW